jgi:hypothetical protein
MCLINARTVHVDFKRFDFSGNATTQELGILALAPATKDVCSALAKIG